MRPCCCDHVRKVTRGRTGTQDPRGGGGIHRHYPPINKLGDPLPAACAARSRLDVRGKQKNDHTNLQTTAANMRICCVAGLLRLDFSGDYVSGRRRGREEEEDTFRMVGDCAIGRQHSACTRKKPRPMKSCERKLDTRYQSRDFLHSCFVS